MDKQTWKNIVEGDKDAYSGLYIAYFKKFYNYGRKFTTDVLLIEDAIQELFLEVWQKKETMLDVAIPNSYLFSSFRYILFRKLRQSRLVVQSNEFADEPEFSIDFAIINREADKELQAGLQLALNALTPRQREAVFLRFYEGLSYEEVAAILNISVKATYKIMARSLSALKDKLYLPLGLILVLLRFSKF